MGTGQGSTPHCGAERVEQSLNLMRSQVWAGSQRCRRHYEAHLWPLSNGLSKRLSQNGYGVGHVRMEPMCPKDGPPCATSKSPGTVPHLCNDGVATWDHWAPKATSGHHGMCSEEQCKHFEMKPNLFWCRLSCPRNVSETFYKLFKNFLRTF